MNDIILSSSTQDFSSFFLVDSTNHQLIFLLEEASINQTFTFSQTTSHHSAIMARDGMLPKRALFGRYDDPMPDYVHPDIPLDQFSPTSLPSPYIGFTVSQRLKRVIAEARPENLINITIKLEKYPQAQARVPFLILKAFSEYLPGLSQNQEILITDEHATPCVFQAMITFFLLGGYNYDFLGGEGNPYGRTEEIVKDSKIGFHAQVLYIANLYLCGSLWQYACQQLASEFDLCAMDASAWKAVTFESAAYIEQAGCDQLMAIIEFRKSHPDNNSVLVEHIKEWVKLLRNLRDAPVPARFDSYGRMYEKEKIVEKTDEEDGQLDGEGVKVGESSDESDFTIVDV